jgi:mono/diheme cytochrome c family protein
VRRAPRAAAAAFAAALLTACLARASPAQDYILYCMGCHGAEAQGVPGRVPPLAGSVALLMSSPEGRNYVLRVPGAANSALSDEQLAAVLNWLAQRYPPTGAAAPAAAAAAFTAAEVGSLRHTPLANVKESRREVVRALAARGLAPPAEY